MSRITKAIAEEVAIKLTQPKQDEINNLKDEFKIEVRDLYLTTIPKKIVEAHELHPKYFDTSHSLSLTSDFGWLHLSYFRMEKERKIYEYHIIDADNGRIIKLSGSSLKLMHKKYLRIESLKADLKNIKGEVEVALYGFKTYKKVETEFPEAFLLLPVKEITTLVVDMKSIRNKLK